MRIAIRRLHYILGAALPSFKVQVQKNILYRNLQANPHQVSPFILRGFTTESSLQPYNLDDATYEKICSETIEALTDYFEEIVEEANNLKSADVSTGDGVLWVNLGEKHGTYVINRQSPNKQIWLSSPTSGPKRYDFVGENLDTGKWIYRHNGESLHELLQREIKDILKVDINFLKLPYS